MNNNKFSFLFHKNEVEKHGKKLNTKNNKQYKKYKYIQ